MKKEVVNEIVKYYGKDDQCKIAMEELSELIQAIASCSKLIQTINKNLRYPNDKEKRENLIEEMADVSIMIEQLKVMFNVSDEEYDKWYEQKTKRVIDRFENAIESEFEVHNQNI